MAEHALADYDAGGMLAVGVTPREVVRLAFPGADDEWADWFLWEKTPFPLVRGEAAERALRDAAVEFREVMGPTWGGSRSWLTTGDHVAALVADILRDRADAVLASGRAASGADSEERQR